MSLTRKDKEKLVLELYNQGKTYREITKVAHMCPRDIKRIVQKPENGNESGQTLSKAAQAYEMFQNGKSPMEVAVGLDLREPEVSQLYRESWNLKQLRDLNLIYLETRGNPTPFLTLYKLSKEAGYSAEHVVWLLGVANKGLSELEFTHHNYKSEAESLEAKKQNLAKIIQDYNNQISTLGNTFYDICLRCEQEEKKLADLREKRMKEEALVRQFEKNNGEYLRITKTVEEKVRATLTNRKKLLDVVASFMIESIQENPKHYSSLIPHDLSSTTDFAGPDFNPFYTDGLQWSQQPKQSKAYFTEDYVTMLAEDTNNLMEKLAKKLEDEILNDYPVNISQPSLPLFTHSDGLSGEM